MTKSNSTQQVDFFRSIAKGDLEQIRTAVAKQSDLLSSYYYASFGATPLTMACFHGNQQVVETLLELGADPDQRSDWHMGPWSPLHCAIYKRDTRLANLLLSHGATMDVHTAAGLGNIGALVELLDENPDRVSELGGDGCQPLHFADSVEVAKLLVDRGADINCRCVDHYSTPVQYLCTSRPFVARYLLSIGATPDIFSLVLCGELPGLERMINQNAECIHARINQSFFPPSSAFDVHNVLTFTIGEDATPLHAAAKCNNGDAIRLLVSGGLSPNLRGGYDEGSPLHIAAWNHSASAAKVLMELGADIEMRSGRMHNNTPAGWAIVAGADEVFDLLIDRGAICHPWFLDDARDACAGRFDQVSTATHGQRAKILSTLEHRLRANQD